MLILDVKRKMSQYFVEFMFSNIKYAGYGHSRVLFVIFVTSDIICIKIKMVVSAIWLRYLKMNTFVYKHLIYNADILIRHEMECMYNVKSQLWLYDILPFFISNRLNSTLLT